MSAHVLLNLLNELRKSDKMRGLSILSLFRKSLIKSIIQKQECHMTLKLLNNQVLHEKFMILPSFSQRYNGIHYITFPNL